MRNRTMPYGPAYPPSGREQLNQRIAGKFVGTPGVCVRQQVIQFLTRTGYSILNSRLTRACYPILNGRQNYRGNTKFKYKPLRAYGNLQNSYLPTHQVAQLRSLY